MPSEKNEERFKVLNYNVATFYKHPENISKIAALIKEQNPDIVCLQEFGYMELTHGDKDTLANYYARILGMKYTKFFRHQDNNFGICILSKFRILKEDTLFVPVSITNAGVYCEFETAGRRLAVISFHLYSYDMNNHSYIPYISLLKQVSSLNRHLQYSYREQERELNILIKKAKSANIPVVLAGDLNNIPDSYFYHTLADCFQDSFMEKGKGRGITYPLVGIGVRIDYQFSSESLEVLDHQVIESNLSDHSALSASYRFR